MIDEKALLRTKAELGKQDLLAVNGIEINIAKQKKDKLYNSISETEMPQ